MILTQFSERGTYLGELGQPLFLPDPRPGGTASEGGQNRIVAIAGMGLPGRFGGPELTVLARELCWALGQLGKRHLATVLIGTGNGNLPIRDAIAAWLAGVEAALGSHADASQRLRRLTFVIHDPAKLRPIQDALREEAEYLRDRDRLEVRLSEIPEDRLRDLEIQDRPREEARQEQAGQEDRTPTRIILGMDGDVYRFGAITETASIPEREVPIDPRLVMRANDELAAESEPGMQFERGLFLGRLLIPADFRSHLITDAPVVMLLDATAARVHWEMVAQAEPSLALGGAPVGASTLGPSSIIAAGFDPKRFLGTSRGFTRQLRTTFSPPPEPPPRLAEFCGS